MLTYCSAAAAVLDPTDLVDLYWAGRGTLVTPARPDPDLRRVFRRFFLGERDEPDERRPFTHHGAGPRRAAVLQVPETEPARSSARTREAKLGLVASDAATLKAKAFAACTPEELAALRRIMQHDPAHPAAPPDPAYDRRGLGRRPDLRRTVRETMRMHGEPARLLRRRRRLRLRPLILILDVSGSMADYSRNLVQFAHTTRRAAVAGRGLLLRHPADPDHPGAASTAARTTRWSAPRRPSSTGRAAPGSASSLRRLRARLGPARAGRGGIVVICSDGLDRGDPSVLATAMDRLSRLCHRIVWLNPHLGDPWTSHPNTLGMMVAAPHVDLLLSGHDLRSLEEFAALLPAA